jgi:hypothetical protein
MSTIANLSISQLKQALDIREKIESLERELNGISDGEIPAPVAPAQQGRRRMSPAARARIAAGARARWARVKGTADTASAPPKKARRKLSAAGRAAIVAATKARWARWAGAKGARVTTKLVKKSDRRGSPAVNAKLAAIARARWRKVKAAGKTHL